MTQSPQQHGALTAYLVLLLALIGCRGPDVSYGENAVLRPRSPAMSMGPQGVAGGASVAGSSGAGGSIEPPPDDDRPIDIPAPLDAGPLDATLADAAIEPDASSGPEPPLEGPYCPQIPRELLDAPASGDGSTSGCAQKLCVSGLTIESLDLDGFELALQVHDPSELRDCTAVIGDLVVHNYAGEDLSPLSCLEVISGSMLILSAPNLASLDGLEHLGYVAQSISIGHGASYLSNVPKLSDIHGLSGLRVVLGSLAIHAPALTSLQGLEQLGAIVGSLELGATSLHGLAGLAGLRGIGGDFVIAPGASMQSMDGAEQLESIGGSFNFGGSSSLRSFDGALGAVRCIGNRVVIQGPNPMLEMLDVFPALEVVGGDVAVVGNPQLRSITMLGEVTHVGGSIAIQDNSALTQLDLGSLDHLGGRLIVLDNPQLEECPLLELADELGRASSSQIGGNARVLEPVCNDLELP